MIIIKLHWLFITGAVKGESKSLYVIEYDSWANEKKRWKYNLSITLSMYSSVLNVFISYLWLIIDLMERLHRKSWNGI